MGLIDNISIRSEKGRPLTVNELDNNFLNIKNYLLAFDAENSVADLDLSTDELIRFGDSNQFSLSSDGNSLVVQSYESTAGSPVFVVKDNVGNNLLEVLENGNIQCSGEFSIDPESISLDLSNLTDLSTDYLTLNNLGSTGALDDEAESGTLGFAAGDLFVKKG